jgi:hypothetical protein
MLANERPCMGAACLNPHFHKSCALEIDDEATDDNASWLCEGCHVRAAELLQNDVAALDDLADGIADMPLLPVAEQAALLASGHVPVADVPLMLGLPRAMSLHDPNDITQPALAVLVKNVARYWRHQCSIGDRLRQIVDQRVAAGIGIVQSDKAADGSFSRYRAAIVDLPMQEALFSLPTLGDDISAGDDTWHLIGHINNMNMYASLSPIAAAGGATMPIVIMLYMAGSGIPGDKSDAITFAHKYLHDVRVKLYQKRAIAHTEYQTAISTGTLPLPAPPPPQPSHPPLPLPTVRLSDKDASFFLSNFNDIMRLAKSPEAKEAFDAVVAKLSSFAEGVTADEADAGKLVVDSLPGVNALGVPHVADLLPPKPSVLKQKYPSVACRQWQAGRTELKTVFNDVVVDSYGPFMRGIAYAALVTLQAGVAAVLASEMSGDTNIAAAILLPVFSLFARDSAAADLIRRY